MDNNGFALGLFIDLNICFGAHIDAAAASSVGLNNTGFTIDNCPSGEIWPRNIFHKLINGDFAVIDQCQTALHHLGEIVGRDIGGHTHGNTGGAIDQQVGDASGHYHRNLFGFVVVGDKIDGIFF